MGRNHYYPLEPLPPVVHLVVHHHRRSEDIFEYSDFSFPSRGPFLLKFLHFTSAQPVESTELGRGRYGNYGTTRRTLPTRHPRLQIMTPTSNPTTGLQVQMRRQPVLGASWSSRGDNLMMTRSKKNILPFLDQHQGRPRQFGKRLI